MLRRRSSVRPNQSRTPLGRGVQQTDRGNRDMAAAIGETLSLPRTDRHFALDQTETRTSTPVEVLNVSVFDNPEGVPDPPPFARRPTVFSAVRPQHGLRDGRSNKRFATTRRSRPRSHHACVAENQSRRSLHLHPTNSRRVIPAKAKPRQTGASAKCPPPPFFASGDRHRRRRPARGFGSRRRRRLEPGPKGDAQTFSRDVLNYRRRKSALSSL